jgi:hypothetical protein
MEEGPVACPLGWVPSTESMWLLKGEIFEREYRRRDWPAKNGRGPEQGGRSKATEQSDREKPTEQSGRVRAPEQSGRVRAPEQSGRNRRGATWRAERAEELDMDMDMMLANRRKARRIKRESQRARQEVLVGILHRHLHAGVSSVLCMASVSCTWRTCCLAEQHRGW